MNSVLKSALAASAGLAFAGSFAAPAFAGGFINSSQSTVFNGMAYAGAAAPGSSSAATMFMNPATMTGFNRLTLDNNHTFGIPTTKITGAYTGASPLNPLLNARPLSGDLGMDYYSPASYVIYPFSEKIFLGVSLNGTYGSTTKADPLSRTSFLAATTKLRIITLTPSIAYKFDDMWSFGVGLQIQHASARQVVPLPPAGAAGAGITQADGWGFGFTAGLTFTPTKTTQIGLGWRSLVEQSIEGTTVLGGGSSSNSKGTLNLPNRLNLSLRQTLHTQFDLLASVEWQNWGRLGHAALSNPAPGFPAVLPFGYSDGWFFSLGGEYRYNDKLTLRAGIGYEVSPVTDAVRRASLPDNDRLWLSTGFTYDLSERFSVNASYSYLHFKKAPITQTLAAGSVFVGESKADAHLLSFGLTSRWGAPPKKEGPVVAKF
jgi:long-chain fatty acid transport protein